MFPNFRSQNVVKILEKMINTEFRRFQNFGISHLVTLPIVILDNYVKKFTGWWLETNIIQLMFWHHPNFVWVLNLNIIKITEKAQC